MRRDLKTFASGTTQQGFSMLEILITLVLIATALLGTAGLQVIAMKVNKGSQFRTQAIFLASDMAERMEANKAESVLGTYAIAATSAVSAAAVDCSAVACSSANLASWDMNQWGQAITNLMPQPTWSITQTVAGNPSTYSIVISWTDRSNVKTVNSGTIVDTYTATRTIGN